VFRMTRFGVRLCRPTTLAFKLLAVHSSLPVKCIKPALEIDGVVMLLGGQRLEKTSVEYGCRATHFTQELVLDMLLLVSPSDAQSNISSLDFSPNAEHRLVKEAENMRIPGNLQSLSKTKSLPNTYRPDDVAVAVCIVGGGGFVALGCNYLRIRIQRKLLSVEKGSIPLKIARHRSRLCGFACYHWHSYFDKINPDPLTAKKFRIFSYIWGRVFEIRVFLSVVARMYLIVEAFISLAAGAYSSVTWTNVLPHIG
jgi:hypothetical protein